MSGASGVGRWLPPQHGAWAFLIVPLLLGLSTADPAWVMVPFAVAWVAAYPLSYFVLQWTRAPQRRRPRYLAPLRLWAAVVAPLAVLLLVVRPWLVWAGLAWAASFAVNAAFARRNDERNLGNDLVQVFQSASALPVFWLLGQEAYTGLVPPPAADIPADVWVLTAACVLAFTGSVLHVKSLIRERRDPRWMWASRVYAVAVVPVAWWLSPWLTVPFAFLAIRAWAITPDRAPKPAVLGAVEAVGSLLLVAFGWLV